jgi:hypothetical protein
VKTESGGSEEGPGKELESGQQEARTCPICGTKFVATTDREFCPVCILRGAFGAKSAATAESDSVAELAPASSDEGSAGLQFRRFENYEVALDEAGRPIELGRGAMGITYKALDVDLRCPVTLKVITERYLGDESAQLRFLREARAAAKVRHSKRRLGVTPGENWEQLLLRDGVRGGGNTGESHQTFWSFGGKADPGNCHAGGCRISGNSRAAPCPPRYQANKHNV